MDPWRVLGVEPGADPAAVHAAYRRLAWRHHPDRGGSSARMRELNAAYAALRRGARPRSASTNGAGDETHASSTPTPARDDAAHGHGRRLAAWLVRTPAGQWLGCLLLLGAVHGAALVGGGACSPLEALAVLLALGLHARSVPRDRSYAPLENAVTFLLVSLRAAAWLIRQR